MKWINVIYLMIKYIRKLGGGCFFIFLFGLIYLFATDVDSLTLWLNSNPNNVGYLLALLVTTVLWGRGEYIEIHFENSTNLSELFSNIRAVIGFLVFFTLLISCFAIVFLSPLS